MTVNLRGFPAKRAMRLAVVSAAMRLVFIVESYLRYLSLSSKTRSY